MKGAINMSIESVLQDMGKYIGKEIFVSDWTQVTQDQINLFADSTKDHQWIHVDKEKAAKGPFGTTIAHGFLTLSHLPFFSYQVPLKAEGSKMSINYGLDKVRFLNPVASGSKIRDRIVLKSLQEKTGNRLLMAQVHTIEIEEQDKPACIAEALSMIFF
jgi:acyl dehydratase